MIGIASRKRKRTQQSIELSAYRDQHYKGTRQDQEKRLLQSTTLYIGNLSFFTTEEQIHELFSRAGDVKRIVMGLDKVRKTPCGFCFVEYYTREDAENSVRYVNGTRLDDRIVRTDWDAGFIEGRQYGRGRSGGQVRDEYRTDYDDGRGGYGIIMKQKSTFVRGSPAAAASVPSAAAAAAAADTVATTSDAAAAEVDETDAM